jgi:HD-like signal output (HDOD) protein/CheY-like chemotaxis protein
MCAIVFTISVDGSFSRAIKEALARVSQTWRLLSFAKTKLALEAAQKERPDVVIVDEALAGMAGVVFLSKIRDISPSSIRILVTNHPTPKGFAFAHQLIAKPFNSAELVAKMSHALAASRNFRVREVREAVLALKSLPVLPKIYYDLLSALGNENKGTCDITAILKQDTAICAGLLRMVNSPVFTYACDGQSITDLGQCVMLLGTERVKGAVLTHQMLRLQTGISEWFFPDRLAQHRRETADLAYSIAQKMDLFEAVARDTFLAGLLHDLGRLVLLTNFPETHERLCLNAMAEKLPISTAESEQFGVSQADIIGFLASLWGMRDGVSNALIYHEHPWDAPNADIRKSAAAVYLAHHAAHQKNASEAFAQIPLNTEFIKAENIEALAG